MITRWEKYGKWRHPIQYWTNELYNYFKHICENEQILERRPRVTTVLKTKVKYKFSDDNNEYVITKKQLEFIPPKNENDLVLYSDGPLLIDHFVKIPIKDGYLSGVIQVEIEYKEIIEEVLETICSCNPHWQTDILSFKHLEYNIYDVLNSHFEKFAFVLRES